MSAVVLFVALLGAWQAYTEISGIDDFILPSPTQVATALFDDRALLWSNLVVTAEEMLLGIAVAAVVALALAFAMHFGRPLRRAAFPLLIGSQTIPLPMIAILLVTWLGLGLAPKVAIVALICFFPIVVTTLDGLAGVDPNLRKLMRTLDASRWQTFWRIELPTALPALMSGAKIAVAVSGIGAVLAEFSGSYDGLGHLVIQSLPQFETARAWAAVVLLSAFAVALFTALSLAERWLLPWAHRSERTST
ncbi:MAG: putative hydroxymethylpyrimidine transport system permease protein [Solirubrobacteraceae bacterium]|nr:putative hydroxymethylpyrimidine transport system permease protein [Solirubrobacteraceae bacterium]